ncbi:MAG: DUF4465 domain-containing protein [Verrucomicrobiota bacterium]|nr:DUF4465 domain-containing protein [Verrucomicrobiota bacterium]
MKKQALLVACAALASATLADTVIDFDGQSTTGNNNAYVAPAVDGLYNWVDNGVTFRHEVVYSTSWNSFTYSSVNDTATAGWGNQYAVYGDGMGMGDTGSYAVHYNQTAMPIVTLPVATTVRGFYANNTTYAALDMLNGSSFSRAFTTASNDWFKLTIEGFDDGGATQGTVDFLLADYTGATGSIVDEWTFVDLSSLGANVKSLGFALSSTDNGAFGMNTPNYFAMDNLTVAAIPEPGTIALMLSGFGGMVLFRRRLKR